MLWAFFYWIMPSFIGIQSPSVGLSGTAFLSTEALNPSPMRLSLVHLLLVLFLLHPLIVVLLLSPHHSSPSPLSLSLSLSLMVFFDTQSESLLTASLHCPLFHCTPQLPLIVSFHLLLYLFFFNFFCKVSYFKGEIFLDMNLCKGFGWNRFFFQLALEFSISQLAAYKLM